MMRDLNGRTAIVTGASAGIGEQIARALAGERMNLVLAARSADKLQSLADELSQTGIRAMTAPTDVRETSELKELVERTVNEFGSIDVLVNNAGIEAFRRYHEIDVEQIRRTIDVNLTATLILTRLVLPTMRESGRGHIVNISSTAGKHGPAYGAAYGASKAGMIALTESLRGEYHGSGISASVICPGFTNSGGIYDRMKREIGRGTPPQMGSTTARAVAHAVIKAVRGDRPELIVNVPPMRPVMVLNEMFPTVGQWIVRRATTRFLKRVATSGSAHAGNGSSTATQK